MTTEERLAALEEENKLLREKLNEVIISLRSHQHGIEQPSSCGCCSGPVEWTWRIQGVEVEELTNDG